MNALARLTCVLTLVAAFAGCTEYFEQPTTPTTPTPTGDLSRFESEMVRGGSASRVVPVTRGGTLRATLNSVTPTVRVGLGIGIPGPTGAGCHLSTQVETLPGANAQISGTVDTATYCVKVFDIGNVVDRVAFSVTIATP